MASVTGKTSETLDDLFATTIESVAVDEGGQFSFARKNGQVVNAGSIGNTFVGAIISAGRLIFTTRNGAKIDAGLVSRPIDAWPVGSVYLGVSPTNPNALLGGGTWVAWGQGRVPVSVDPNQAEFSQVEGVWGSKVNYIAPAQLPPHQHGMAHSHSMNHAHPATSGSAPGGSTLAFARSNNASTITGGGPVEAITANTGGASPGATDAGPGTNQPVNNLQPYINCYMWKRVA